MLQRTPLFEDFDNPQSFAGPAAWENETFRKLSRSRALAWIVTSVCLVLALLSVLAAFVMALKLGSMEPVIIKVDRTTGHAERQTEVTGTSVIAGDEALAMSYVVNYVMDRETYDPADNGTRIFEVQDLSVGMARETWAWDWDYSNTEHLERVYGNGQVVAVVQSAQPLDDNTATVNFTKTYRASGKKPVTQPFVAIVTFGFVNRPKSGADIWKNPLGFEVSSYRAQPQNTQRSQ